MDIGHGSEVTTMVPWNLYDAASGCDQFVHVESSLLGLNRDILLEVKKEVWF